MCRLILIVFWLCILLIKIIFGFWCKKVCSNVEKLRLIFGFICIWLICEIWYFIGFFVVMIFLLDVLSLLSVLYKVVVFFELVGLVIRIMLWGCFNWWCKCSNKWGGIFDFLSFLIFVDWLSKCIIIDLLCWIGMVDIWILMDCFFIWMLKWLFCGRCFFEIFRFVINFKCSIKVEVIFILWSKVLCNILLICWCKCSMLVFGLICIFEVFIWIVFLNSELISLIIVILLLFELVILKLKLLLVLCLVCNCLVNEIIFLVWW